MSFALRRLPHIHTVLPRFFCPDRVRTRLESTGCQWLRYSTVSKTKHELKSSVDILYFLRCSLHEPKGPSHCWFNTHNDYQNLLEKDGIVLVLSGAYNEGSPKASQDVLKMFEGAKILQRRYPFLKVVGLQYGKSLSMNDVPMRLLRRVIEEYIPFPLLLSNKDMFENASCCIISRGLKNPILFPGSNVDFKVLDKAIHDLNVSIGKGTNANDFQSSSWVKPAEVIKEPELFSASRNLLLSFPGCISVDERGNRFFLSDVNHHRIIVFDSDGMILDAIGSSPGFEDGEFENAKLMRPAASLYHASEDCLYFVDSENHAIRRAHMESRNVTTVFPTNESNANNKGLWEWIMSKIRTKRNTESTSEENSRESFLFPWHLLSSSNNDLFVLNRSFQTLWIIDLVSASIKEVVQEPSKILEMCEHAILEKRLPLKQIPAALLPKQYDFNCSLDGIPHADLISSVATYRDHVVFCDKVGQTVAKFNTGSGSSSSFEFSNFGILGLPYWLSFSLERAYAVGDAQTVTDPDHVESFSLKPGKVVIELNVNIPPNTDLVEQPQEGCIWCQTRGTAVEVSGLENTSLEKSRLVGVSQQFYDEIDGLSFWPKEEEETNTEAETKPLKEEVPEGKCRIGFTINTSPGTSEVIIYAALYLRLKKGTDMGVKGHEKKAETIARLLEPMKKSRRDILTNLLSMSKRNLEEVVFTRPLHVKLKFDTNDHPKADNTKDVILTESTVEVNVVL